MRPLVAALAVLTVVAAVAAESAVATAAVGGTFAEAPTTTLSRWTPARRAAAASLPALRLSRDGGLAGATTSSSAAAVEGVDTGDPTLFPNRANGTVYGQYTTTEGTELYQCSGSVVHSPAGDLVLTAGHCVIDPETGVVAHSVVFVPGYRESVQPYGAFAATSWVTTPEWESTAGGGDPDEAGDLAFLVLAPGRDGASVEATVGALSIAFEQPREATYTQWGYPGEPPYDGEVLYSHTAAYAGSDPLFSPPSLKIASDFTAGSSGGPWTVGPASAPTVVSLTDYYYEGDPRHVYGAYFGAAARSAYEAAGGVVVPADLEAGSGPGEGPGPGEESGPGATVATPNPPAAVVAPAGDPAAAEVPLASAPALLRVRGVRRRPGGAGATLLVRVGGPGELRLSGPKVRTRSLAVGAAGVYRLPVDLKGGATPARTRGSRTTVGVWVRFTSSAGTRHVSRLIEL